jgi:hypothetical protein
MALTGMTGRSMGVAGARSTKSQGRWKAASSYSCSLQRARACQGQMTASEPHGVLLYDPNTSWEGRSDEHVGQWLRRDTARGQPRAASAGAGVSVRCGYESRSYSSERPRPRATHARACRPHRNIRSLPPPEAHAPGPPSGSPLSSPARPVGRTPPPQRPSRRHQPHAEHGMTPMVPGIPCGRTRHGRLVRRRPRHTPSASNRVGGSHAQQACLSAHDPAARYDLTACSRVAASMMP